MTCAPLFFYFYFVYLFFFGENLDLGGTRDLLNFILSYLPAIMAVLEDSLLLGGGRLLRLHLGLV